MLWRRFLLLTVTTLLLTVVCGKEKKIIEVRYGPVLYDLVTPDSLERGSSNLSYVSVAAYDPDGQNNIDSVFFISTRPDGSTNGMHLYLNDNGQLGDSVVADGIFSVTIQPPSDTSQAGEWLFTFYARDKEENPSNHPQANVTVY